MRAALSGNSISLAAFLLTIALIHPFNAMSANEEIERLIQAAGNAEPELERFRFLRELEQRPDLDPALKADLEKLMPVVDLWANGKAHVVVDHSRAAENGYLCRFIKARIGGTAPIYPPAMSAESRLEPIWAMYRGRMLIWQVIQSGPLLGVKESREAYYGEGRRLMEQARKAFPRNRVIRMYLGEPIPWPKSCDPHPEAPDWANLQREGLEKLTDLIHWWVDERQLPDGQFGGGWGDDVEMWRWWTPVLIAFDDPKAAAGQERLSNGIFGQPHMKEGFTSRMTDVEHSNEDTTDTILPLMHLRPDDPLWKGRALRLAELMRERWTGRNERGFLQFKSIYFNVERVDEDPGRAFDTVFHPSVIQPVLLYWQRTGDRELGKLFCDWLKVWVDGTARADQGKPAGVLPSVIHWPDGAVAKQGRPWFEPFDTGHNDRLYNWPSAARLMTSTMLLAWHMSRDERYLQPIRSMAAIRLKHFTPRTNADPGSEAWAAAKMDSFLADTLAKYRFLSGDTQYDRLLQTDASGYVQFRLSGETRPLFNALRRNAEAFRSNWEAYTAEMRWTDRVISFTRNYLQHLPEPAPPGPAPDILYSSATGDPGNPLVFPLNAVRWLTQPREIAALVTQSAPSRFEAELFHFGKQTRRLGAELYLLSPGRYEVRLVEKKSNREIQRDRITVEGQRTRINLELPAEKLCALRVVRAGKD